MALFTNAWIWSVVRLISGISSGLVFVLVSSIVLDELQRKTGLHCRVYSTEALALGLPALVYSFRPSVTFLYGTFMGITKVETTLGRKLRPNDSGRAIGLMTGVYGVGQIVGAGGAGVLAGQSGGFGVPTLIAGGVLFVGAIMLTAGSFVTTVGGRSIDGEYDIE